MRVNLGLHSDAVLDVFKLLVQNCYILMLKIRRTSLLLLFMGPRVMLIKVVALDRLLENLNYLFPRVLFVLWSFGSRLESLVINLLIHLA